MRQRPRGFNLGNAIATWIEGLQTGEPVAYAVLVVILLLAALIGYVFLADRREDSKAKRPLKKVRHPTAKAGGFPAGWMSPPVLRPSYGRPEPRTRRFEAALGDASRRVSPGPTQLLPEECP